MEERNTGINQGSGGISCPKSFRPWIVALVILALLTLGWVIIENYRDGGIVWRLFEHDDVRKTLRGNVAKGGSGYKAVDLPNVNVTQGSYHGVIEAVRPGLVSIDVAVSGVGGGGVPGEVIDGPVMNYTRVGSGVIISDDGYVLTSWHVIDGASAIKGTVYSGGGGKEYPMKLVNIDKGSDLALMRIMSVERFSHVILGDSDAVRTGDVVLAMGSPFGFDQTITTGIISSRNRTVSVGGKVFEGMLQTDTSINRGNSGGPLVNMRGEVIGINTAIYSPTGAFSGIGFAVPINKAMSLVGGVVDFQGNAPAVGGGQLAMWGRQGRQTGNSYKQGNGRIVIAPHNYRGKCIECHPRLVQGGGVVGAGLGGMIPVAGVAQGEVYLGAKLLNVDELIAKQFKLTHPGGVLVDSVEAGSPAEVGGLQRGDIIHRVDGRRVMDVVEMQKLIVGKGVGGKVDIVVMREGGRKALKVVLGGVSGGGVVDKAGVVGAGKGVVKQPAEYEWMGAEIVPIGAALQGYVSGGVYVAEAAGVMGAAGVMKGDIIKGMNNRAVGDMVSFIKLSKKANLKEGILLDVIRSGKPMYITVKG